MRPMHSAQLYYLGHHLDHVHLPSLALAAGCLALTLAWPKPWAKVLPPQASCLPLNLRENACHLVLSVCHWCTFTCTYFSIIIKVSVLLRCLFVIIVLIEIKK